MDVLKVILLSMAICCVAGEQSNEETYVEARGKGKYALLMHFFYVAATKLFILKVIYGVIFYVIVAKGWHLVLWLIHYLKEKQPHEHYIEYDHDHDHHHDFSHHDHYSHHGYYDRVEDFAQDVPYSAHKPSYGKFENSYGKKVYDADGSYSVKNS